MGTRPWALHPACIPLRLRGLRTGSNTSSRSTIGESPHRWRRGRCMPRLHLALAMDLRALTTPSLRCSRIGTGRPQAHTGLRTSHRRLRDTLVLVQCRDQLRLRWGLSVLQGFAGAWPRSQRTGWACVTGQYCRKVDRRRSGIVAHGKERGFLVAARDGCWRHVPQHIVHDQIV